MCKTQNLYVLHLGINTASGGIEWETSKFSPQLIDVPCKIVIKQILTEISDSVAHDITGALQFRVIHNIKTNAFSNFLTGTSNTLGFIDAYSIKNNGTNINIGYTSTTLQLYAPNGLPSFLTLNRVGAIPPATDINKIIDDPSLLWSVTLEVTINPDEN